MNYLVVVKFELNGKWSEISRDFCDYEAALDYAQNEYERKADNITVLLYELKKSFN